MAEQRFSSRAHHLESTRTWSTLPAVAEAVAAVRLRARVERARYGLPPDQ